MQQLPFSPFGLDVRKEIEADGKKIPFLATWLDSQALTKYETWLRDLNYTQLFSLDTTHWEAIQAMVDQPAEPESRPTGSGEPKPGPEPKMEPTPGGINKLSRLIEQLRERRLELIKYDRELHSHLKGETRIRVERLYEILTYLLRIANYPMDKTRHDNNISGAIIKMVRTGIHFFYICFVV